MFAKIKIAKHFFARAICLIAIPIVIYITCFWVHFQALPRTGDGALFMSAGFQSSLLGSKFIDTFAGKSSTKRYAISN
jgi:dolichyl-phosphate-mannose-protein mannosyltransferase